MGLLGAHCRCSFRDAVGRALQGSADLPILCDAHVPPPDQAGYLVVFICGLLLFADVQRLALKRLSCHVVASGGSWARSLVSGGTLVVF